MSKAPKLNLIEQMLSIADANISPSASATASQIKRFMDEIPGGFLIYRADGDEEILYANHALQKIFACDSFADFCEHTHKSFKGLVHPLDLAAVEKSITEQIGGGHDNLDYVEYRIRDKDGNIRWVEDYGHFIRSETLGDIFYVFIIDATEKIVQKHLHEHKLQSLIEEYDNERKLIRQEHLQRLEVIEGLSVNYDSILYADFAKNKVLPYRLSSRLETQFESKLQEKELAWFLDDYIKVWVHPDDRKLVAEKTTPEFIREKLKEANTFYLNYRTVQNGETQYLQLRIVNVSRGDEVSQAVLGYRNVDEEILQEINKKKILEEALKNANLANVAKNSFLSNMSHDMRTPLNAIFGFANLAKKNIYNPSSTKAYIEKIEKAGGQMLELIEHVLELSDMESSDFRFTESECDLRETVYSMYTTIAEKARAKDIKFVRNLSAVKHPTVYADREKLLQILNHICDNAIKYTPKNGEVYITVSESSSSHEGYSAYRFDITDTGRGIAPDVISRVFDPFEREHNTTMSGEYGSGLGLTIAKHLTEMMGGGIEVQSELGSGSTFSVALTFRTKDVSESNAENELTVPANILGSKLLLVEDNEINLEIETEILEDLGFEVDTAENGKIAVDKVSASRPGEYAFILMDIQMPVMDGRQAAAEIRKLPDPALAAIPIIALSANAFESDKRASVKNGMNAHLTKPMDVEILLKTIAETLR